MNVGDIFDAVIEAGNIRHKKWEISQLEVQNQDLKAKCGSCKLWMTQQCPSESHFKVSCGNRVCDKFDINKWTVDLISKNELKIAELKQELNKTD